MRKWTNKLLKIAESVREEIKPFLSSVKNANGEKVEEIAKEIDEIAERKIIEEVEKLKIPCVLLTEEYGLTEFGSNPKIYVVADPIDGTTNAVRGVPYSAISIAISEKPDLSGLIAGVVLNLFTGDKYTAEKGLGAYKNGKRIRVSNIKELKHALVTVDLSKTETNTTWIGKISQKVSAIRCLGSAALELCHLASGETDIHIDIRGRIRPIDVAAGIIIVWEAGGKTLIKGKITENSSIKPKEKLKIIAAANETLIKEIIKEPEIKNILEKW